MEELEITSKAKLYRLSTFEDNKFNTIRIINEDNFNSLAHDCEIIKEAHNQLVVFKFLQLNIKEYSLFINRTSGIPVTQVNIRTITSQSFLLETNKLILNILMSFSFFLDNAGAYLTRKYRTNETIVEDFKKLRSYHYDNSFAYRFLTKLRNYSIHLGFLLQGIGFHADENIENPEKMIGEIQLLIDINLLKQEKRLLSGKVYNEVLEINDDIDLKPLIYELSKSILNIQEFIYSVQKDEIENSIENIEMFVGTHKTKANEIKVFYDLNSQNDSAEFMVYDVPFEMIEDFKSYKKQINKEV